MSTSYEVYCQDCDATDEYAETYNDQRYYEIAALVKNAAAIAALAPMLKDVDVSLRIGARHVGLEFFAAHAGHKLVPRSEYGEIDDGKD